MAKRRTRDALQQLHALAGEHGGHFTAKQAAKLGYDYPHLTYHTKAGNIERVGHGVYRLLTVPESEHDDLVRLSLWSRNRADEPQAVVSHATALVLHGLTELLPGKLHLTVPPRFQKKPPRGCALHKGRLSRGEIEERDGFRVTTPLRTLLDAAASDDVPQDDLTRAMRVAIETGLVRREALVRNSRGTPAEERIDRALGRARTEMK
jgi:predicted transcriptional regulator of viral defense system